MSIRTKELLVLSGLACLMAAWTVCAAGGFFSETIRRANVGERMHVLAPATVGVLLACACLAILFVIAHSIRAILRETPPADEQSAQEEAR